MASPRSIAQGAQTWCRAVLTSTTRIYGPGPLAIAAVHPIHAPGLNAAVTANSKTWVGNPPTQPFARDTVRCSLTFEAMSKRTSKKKAKVRRSKANHGRKPNMGRNS